MIELTPERFAQMAKEGYWDIFLDEVNVKSFSVEFGSFRLTYEKIKPVTPLTPSYFPEK